MKRPTINRVAKANISINRKAYISLFLGILTAVFLATATSLCAWGTVRGHEEQMAKRVGWMDMFTLGGDDISDEQILRSGFFDEIGHVTVSAAVAGKSVCAGYYDGTADRLLNRTMKEGRMPEKAGEIAAEQSALIRLGLENTRIGDTVTLDMEPYYGTGEEKTFVLVGILNEQTKYLETYMDEENLRFPALLISPEETFADGCAETHRVMTYAPLITLNQVQRNCPVRFDTAFGVSRESGKVIYYDSGWDRAAYVLNRILIWAVLGAALMLSACVGITSSMESLLTCRTEDIGMLRAIGATRRQVRRIYGMEAWMLTVTALPGGLLLGVLFAWLVSRIAPDQLAFSLNVWLLIPILGLSALCVFIASRVPLYHASRQMPMGVLRDTALLKKAGKIRFHKTFRPDRLIAGRRTRLHPMQRLGAAGMVALMLLSTLMLGELALGMRSADRENPPAFRLSGPVNDLSIDPFSELIPETAMSPDELSRLNEIEGVSRVSSVTRIRVNLLMEKTPGYFRSFSQRYDYDDGSIGITTFGILDSALRDGGGDDWLFWNGEDPELARARENRDWIAETNVEHFEQMEAIRALLGITETLIPVEILVTDIDEEALRGNVEDGTIDISRLDSGEQVLVYAPALCLKKEGDALYSDAFMLSGEIRDEEWDKVIRNDVFTAGMTLDMLELAGNDSNAYSRNGTPDWKTYYRNMEAIRTRPAVGAVLTGSINNGDIYLYGFTVITTPAGAKALGLKIPGPETAEIWLSGNPNPEKEAEIEEKISQVVLRGWMDVNNQLRLTREYQAKKLRQMLLFTGLIFLFFAVSVFMQVSAAARHIRSETRTIGTLRAVGADLETLVGIYLLPVRVCVAAGLIPCLLFYAVTEIPGCRLFTENHPLIMIPLLVIMACIIAVACVEGIRSRLAAVTRQSIVDNIREL